MVKEFMGRPFCRPLLFWITGILLQTTFHFRFLALGLLFIPLGLLPASLVRCKKRNFLFIMRGGFGEYRLPVSFYFYLSR